MNSIATEYVHLVLHAGLHDSDFVDAFYGPAELKPAENATADQFPIKSLIDKAGALTQQLEALEVGEQLSQRKAFLLKQLRAVETRLRIVRGEEIPFDQESQLLYDAVAPKHDAAYFENLLQELDAELPGNGPLVDRLAAFKKEFIIPKDKLDAVFQAAIDEARKRTQQHITLPENENFTVEYVTDKAWSGYNWYKGNAYSLIQINTDLPIYIDRAVDLGCHEGYPGHHVFNALLEKNLSIDKGWVEFTVYPLFSPQSLIAEGSANYGILVAFPGEERVTFERDVLFPIAGLDPAQAEKYDHIARLAGKLSYAGNEAARNLLDGVFTEEQAVDWLVKYALMTRDRAEQRVKFIRKYRSYVINYNLGQDIVKTWIESNGGDDAHPEKRWELFTKLLSTPYTASMLK